MYHLGLPQLEQKQFGFCRQVKANYEDIGQAAFKDPSGIRKPLVELQGVVCDIEIGKPIKNGKKATVIRRYCLSELMGTDLKSKVVDRGPEHANELAELLQSRLFVYGDIACVVHCHIWSRTWIQLMVIGLF